MLMGQGIPTLVADDFNYIDNPQEKPAGRAFVDGVESREFQGFMEDNGLVGLGFDGPHFTWCNNHQGGARVWEKIDKNFAGADWIQNYPRYQVLHLPRIASDHYH